MICKPSAARSVVFVVALACALSASGLALREGADDDPKPDAAAEPFALVELFTSEGCSSCPPADAVLADIAHRSRRDKTRVFALSFHVDYWDRLGWVDPYSTAAHTKRQRDYAAAFGSERIYTPQMIVNGQAQFVGSNAPRAEEAIEKALKVPAAVALSLSSPRVEGRDVRVEYALGTVPEGAVLHVALVQRDLKTKVERGENGGRTLRHENVVRDLRALNDLSAGETQLRLPDGAKPQDCSIVAWLQQAKDMRVLAAAGCDLTGEK